MFEIELSAGVIEYEDTGGDGSPLVMLHGLAMDGRVWGGVVEDLGSERRCVLPTLPFGSHRKAMHADADLSLRGMGRIVAELLEQLDLSDVTLCFNDWGGAQTMIADGLTDRVGRLVLASCETARNYPPGLAGHAAWLSGKLPGGISLMRALLGSPQVRKLPMVYGQMSKRGVPDALLEDWLEPLKRAEIRRDLRKYLGAAGQGRRDIRAATPTLANFDRPVLVVWDREGKMMPNEEGRRLAQSFPDARLVELDECYTLIPMDQPKRLATELKLFLKEPAGGS